MCLEPKDNIWWKSGLAFLENILLVCFLFSYDKSAVYYLKDMSCLPYHVLFFLFLNTSCLTLVWLLPFRWILVSKQDGQSILTFTSMKCSTKLKYLRTIIIFLDQWVNWRLLLLFGIYWIVVHLKFHKDLLLCYCYPFLVNVFILVIFFSLDLGNT